MLELILTRGREQRLIDAASDLRFLVLDEMHTYRGRQGADVALLVRRLRDTTGAKDVLHVGTSATLSSGEGTLASQQAEVAEFASDLFGRPVSPDSIIGETLVRATAQPPADWGQPLRDIVIKRAAITAPDVVHGPNDHAAFVVDPLAVWIEATVGFATVENTLVRAQPLQVGGTEGIGALLAKATGLDQDTCVSAVQQILLEGSRVKDPTNYDRPTFAFRLHQFVSRAEGLLAHSRTMQSHESGPKDAIASQSVQNKCPRPTRRPPP